MTIATQHNGKIFQLNGVTYRTDIHCGPFVTTAWSYSNKGEGYVSKVTHERIETVRISPVPTIVLNLTRLFA